MRVSFQRKLFQIMMKEKNFFAIGWQKATSFLLINVSKFRKKSFRVNTRGRTDGRSASVQFFKYMYSQ